MPPKRLSANTDSRAGHIALPDIDSTNGKRANGSCPLVVREVFLAGTEPPPCDEHDEAPRHLEDWWQRLRDWFQR